MKKRIHLLQRRNIKEAINLPKKVMINMPGPKASINLNGLERTIIHIINPLESCGVNNCQIIKKMKEIKIILITFGAQLQQEVELGQSTKMNRELEMIPTREKLSKERKRVWLITICSIPVKLLGVLNVAAFHKSTEIKMEINLLQMPDTLMIIKILRLELPNIKLMIYKSNFLIK
tara:strand:+ start:1660 stop:2187 length:528 start_codon:yes stop_codon:yes gene_type:complete